jgi:hypothetical protein
MGKRVSILPTLGVIGLLGAVGYVGYMGYMKERETKEGFKVSTGTTIGLVIGGIVVTLLGIFMSGMNMGGYGSDSNSILFAMGGTLTIVGIGMIAAPFSIQ